MRHHRRHPLDPETYTLFLEARRTLILGQKDVGDLLGVSRRTVQRWAATHTGVDPAQLATLAKAVYPRDPALAEKLARAAGTTTLALGFGAPARPPAYLVDVVVCAAAEALTVPPTAVRPALLAAFRRAREVGLRVEDVEHALGEAARVAAEAKARARERRNVARPRPSPDAPRTPKDALK